MLCNRVTRLFQNIVGRNKARTSEDGHKHLENYGYFNKLFIPTVLTCMHLSLSSIAVNVKGAGHYINTEYIKVRIFFTASDKTSKRSTTLPFLSPLPRH